MSPRLETPRLVLRPFTTDDVPAIYRLSQEPALRRFLPDQVYGDEAEAARVLASLIAQYASPVATSAHVLAVELKQTAELIGHVGLSPVGEQTELGFAIAAAHQRHGYATEVVGEAVRWAFDHHRLPGVLGVVDRDNVGSMRVLERAGFVWIEDHPRAPHDRHGGPRVVRTYRATPSTIRR